MKRKLFFSQNAFLHFVCLLISTPGYCGVYLCTDIIVRARWDIIHILFFVLCLLVIAYCMKWVYAYEHNHILLNRDSIDVPDDRLPKNLKIQYETSVAYLDIKELSYRNETTDSRGKRIEKFSYLSVMDKPYLVITTDSGKVERVFLFWYLKRQRKKIIRELFARCPNCISDLDEVLHLVDTTNSGTVVIDFPLRRSRRRKSKKRTGTSTATRRTKEETATSKKDLFRDNLADGNDFDFEWGDVRYFVRHTDEAMDGEVKLFRREEKGKTLLATYQSPAELLVEGVIDGWAIGDIYPQCNVVRTYARKD